MTWIIPALITAGVIGWAVAIVRQANYGYHFQVLRVLVGGGAVSAVAWLVWLAVWLL